MDVGSGLSHVAFDCGGRFCGVLLDLFGREVWPADEVVISIAAAHVDGTGENRVAW